MGENCMNHEKRISSLDSSFKSARHRIDELARNNEILMEITETLKTLIEQNKKIDKIEEDITCLKGKLGQYFDKAIGIAITVLISGFMGAILTLIIK